MTRRTVVILACALLCTVIIAALVCDRSDESAPSKLTVGWGGTDGRPACVYFPEEQIVRAKLRIDGRVDVRERVTVTVSAYADENTTDQVGSGSRTLSAEGTVRRAILITIPVDRPPHVDIDGVAACQLEVKRQPSAL